ncbi:MAG TPA: gamma-glutamyltransferase [Candidatus Methylomirabilis sp.]|nr:gamma-glutamyltransferase [Candidatus Methylomirabilis sp.]
MLNTPRATRGMVVAPHHLAAQAGLAVLREGGNAVEAAVAAAAAIAVVYPHMNSIGGDNFWLIAEPGREPVAILACGSAGERATVDAYRGRGCETIPPRGPLAANTVAGVISGWQAALRVGARWGGRLPLGRILADAIQYARVGAPVTFSQHRFTLAKLPELRDVPGFAGQFLTAGEPPAPASIFRQPRLADTLERLANAGLEDFYYGEIGAAMAAELARVGSPVTGADLVSHHAVETGPLCVRLRCGTAYNAPPPTQGLASLILLGVFDRLGCAEAEGFPHLHGLVESTKQAFLVRDRVVTDPAYLREDPAGHLTEGALADMARRIRADRALPWPSPAQGGDTVWLGVIDGQGRAASLIQSIYWEFGSGLVLGDTGVLWQNRGVSFSLAGDALNVLRPGRKPFHTLNPAMARLDDGRVMVYGTMGGEGQPQTQAAVFTRYALFGQELQAAVTAPRWLLGRTWGAASANLKLEGRFDAGLVEALRAAGHEVEVVTPWSDLMGHAGAIVLHASGVMEGAADPRGDGLVAAF